MSGRACGLLFNVGRGSWSGEKVEMYGNPQSAEIIV